MTKVLRDEIRQLVREIVRESLPQELRTQLPQSLSDLRHRSLMEVDDVARAAKISPSQLRRYERGAINSVRHQHVVHNLKRLASVYRCSFDEILCATKESIREARECSKL